MPIFLVHGFRWNRNAIRRFIDHEGTIYASPSNLMSIASNRAMTEAFNFKFPTQVAELPGLAFIEAYDPMNATPQPYAYVCDTVIQQDTTINVTDALSRGSGLSPVAWQAMYDLSEEVAGGARVEWYAIYNGDPESGRMGYGSGRERQQQQQEEEEGKGQEEEEEDVTVPSAGEKAKGGRKLRAIRSLFFR